ncbi:endolysin [Arthrobacter phage Pureglobe5]|nr:lysin A [Arthrobacter phage Beagle]UYL87395.1 endolysin [Arthrobacter phage Pureglobe5]
MSTGFTLPTSRPVTQPWAAEFDDWDGDGIVDIPGGFYHSIGWFGHNGIDFGCFEGDPVEAVADGTVIFAGDAANHYLLSGGGNVAFIHHEFYGVWTESLHMSRVIVANGQRVTKGQVIGYAGSTGSSTASHLHLGMFASEFPNQWDGWRGRIDPTPYLYGALNSDYAIKTHTAQIKEAEMPAVLHKVVSPAMNRRLAKGKAAVITTDATNTAHQNFAVGGVGTYDIQAYVAGTGLPDGQRITGRFLLVEKGKAPSGYYPFQIDGTFDGKFNGLIGGRFKVNAGTVIWIELTSTVDTSYVASVDGSVLVHPFK